MWSEKEHVAVAVGQLMRFQQSHIYKLQRQSMSFAVSVTLWISLQQRLNDRICLRAGDDARTWKISDQCLAIRSGKRAVVVNEQPDRFRAEAKQRRQTSQT